MIAAARNVAPDSGVRSDNASRVGQITTPWWQMLAACMSSRTRPWPMVALAKGRVARRGKGAGADDGCAVFNLARDADRLAAPRVVARLEGTGEKIQQADFRLGDDFGIEAAGIDGKCGARQRSRQRHLRLIRSIRSSWQSPSRAVARV
jgi:hypothetical protein